MITQETIGSTPDGQSVQAFTLTNRNHLSLRVLTLGGIVSHLFVPDANGTLADITLGLPSLDAYLEGHPYFGALVGRVAGRLTRGTFSANGKTYTLPCNQPPNHLHGGFHALDKKIWDAEILDDQSLRLRYTSPDGEEGYPGTVNISVTYMLTNDNEWVLEYEATSDQSTPFSMTNHAYFNLAGEPAGDIRDHVVQIHADSYVPVDAEFTLQDRIAPVETNDFRSPRLLSDALPGLFGQHGDNYLLNGTGFREAARVHHPATGRTLIAYTDTPVLQFYTGFNLTGEDLGKSGKKYLPFSAFCLECQGYPAGVNDSPIGNIMLHPGQTYRQRTVYAFRY